MTLTEKIELVTYLSGKLLGKLSNHLKIRIDRLFIVVATGDAATTGITYGAVSAAAAALTELLYTHMKVRFPKKEKAGVIADFVGNSSTCDISVVFSMRVYEGLFTMISLAYNYLKKTILGNRKG